ncbi:MAG: hypothetical protein D6800_05360, partial [Candidatus Zixiibacteriota bacterium]
MRKPLRFLGLLLLLCLAVPPNMYAVNSNAGTSAFSFLKINLGARPVAMGGAFTGLADDINALYYNPAGLALLEDDQYVAGYNNYFVDMQSGFVGYAKKQGFDRSIAVFASYLTLGSFVQTDLNGNVTGDFNGGDFVLGGTYALSFRQAYA